MPSNSFVFTFKWAFPYVMRYKGSFLLTVGLIALAVALQIAQADYIRLCVDAALIYDWRQVFRLAGLFCGVMAARLARDWAYGRVTCRMEAAIRRDLKNEMVQAALEDDTEQALIPSTGTCLTRHNEDTEEVSGFIQHGLTRFLTEPLLMIGGLVYLMQFHLPLSLLTFAATPVLAGLLYRRAERAGQLHGEQMEKRSEYMTQLHDAVQGAEVVRAYQMQPFLQRKTRPVLDGLYDAEIRYCFNDSVAVALIMGVSYVPYVAALLFGGHLVMGGILSVSVLFAYAQLISTINAPAIQLFSAFNHMKKAFRSMKRLNDSFLAPKERNDGEATEPGGVSGAAIRFEAVCFGYDAVKVLNGVHWCVPAGKRVGLTGESGAGKTTLVNLVCGLFEASSGSVMVLGRDTKTWALTALRKRIAYVSQDNAVLPGTMYDNIRAGDWDASQEAVIDAAERAGLMRAGLTQGFDTPLSENGSHLSGGQRQRIGLARALLRDADIFIFDEPTASLDPDTEAFVMNSIAAIPAGKTIIIISHTPEALACCDEIYRLQEGRMEKVMGDFQ